MAKKSAENSLRTFARQAKKGYFVDLPSAAGDPNIETLLSAGGARVQHVCASVGAFAALKFDGTVVAWGDAACGGHLDDVANRKENIIEIHACVDSFAGVTRSGEIIAWGGSTKDLLKLKLRGIVKEIYRQGSAYAVVWNSGFVQCGFRGCPLTVPSEVLAALQNATDD